MSDYKYSKDGVLRWSTCDACTGTCEAAGGCEVDAAETDLIERIEAMEPEQRLELRNRLFGNYCRNCCGEPPCYCENDE